MAFLIGGIMFNLFKKKNDHGIVSPCDGDYVAMHDIEDAVFSKAMMGPCFAVRPANENVYAPVEGTVAMIFPTKHAFGIKMNDVDVIVHIGIDTVNLQGEGFEVMVKEGQKVNKGDLLAKVDFDLVKKNGYKTDVIVALQNVELDYETGLNQVKAGDHIANVK